MMTRLRFTIGGLIAVIAVVAIGLAAIRSGSPTWAGAMQSITFFAMISSFLGIALGLRETTRVLVGLRVTGLELSVPGLRPLVA